MSRPPPVSRDRHLQANGPSDDQVPLPSVAELLAAGPDAAAEVLKELPPRHRLRFVCKALKKRLAPIQVCCFISARVPIVKLHDPRFGLSCDINCTSRWVPSSPWDASSAVSNASRQKGGECLLAALVPLEPKSGRRQRDAFMTRLTGNGMSTLWDAVNALDGKCLLGSVPRCISLRFLGKYERNS